MTSPRTYWKVDRLSSGQGMDGRVRVENQADAILVSSLTESGLHAPCFDFDFASELVGFCELVCRVEISSFDWHWRQFAKSFEACGLGKAELTRGPWRDHAWNPLDGSLNDLLDTVTLRFARAVQRVSSSTEGHAHIYVDHELDWTAYAELVASMLDVGLLQSGFARNSLDRGMTMLIRPGLTKAELEARGIEIDDGGSAGGDEGEGSTRGGSPEGAVDPDRETTDGADEIEEETETMETIETQNQTDNTPPPEGATDEAGALAVGPKLKNGETLLRKSSGEYPVPLSDVDRKKYSDQLAELCVRVAAIEEKKKQVTAGYVNELKKVKLDINRLSSAVNTGKELRMIEVFEVLDPSGGVVNTVRVLDGVNVGTRAASHEDRQYTLPGTVAGFDSPSGDDDDTENEGDDDGEPHELDDGPNGETVQASGGASVYVMPDDDDDDQDDDDDDDDDGEDPSDAVAQDDAPQDDDEEPKQPTIERDAPANGKSKPKASSKSKSSAKSKAKKKK